MEPWIEFDRLVMEPFGPFKELHSRAHDLVQLATRDAGPSSELTVAIEEFRSRLEIMSVRIQITGRDSVELAPGQENCAEALRTLEAHCGRAAH